MRQLGLAALVLIVISVALFATGCATGYCRQVKSEKNKEKSTAAAATPAAKATSMAKTEMVSEPDKKELHFFVYKYDGSLQCAMGQPQSPEDMEKQLRGLKVFSRQKKSDGLMHIQVCGQPTGQANVYEISEKDLNSAEARGFKKWDFE